ncbi:TPR-like protein [Mycena maculata]|uniref:TPR-like protein n=1 Tax=Mycena maculata TaxID=230809 RepID=A0AAD7JSV2_9AGAR|nr:TPR-like protein [Mycena maculata]
MHERLLLRFVEPKKRAYWLSRFGEICLGWYGLSGAIDDLTQATCVYNDAVRDDPEAPEYHHDLAKALHQRYERLGDVGDLDRSVSAFGAAVGLTPDGARTKPLRLDNLGNALCSRFERLGDLNDIEESVLKCEEALMLTEDGDMEKPYRLRTLGYSLHCRFIRLGKMADLDKSISTLDSAVQGIPEGPDKPLTLNCLGVSLSTRFRVHQADGLTDLERSVALFQDAVDRTPEHHPHKFEWLNNLASSLHNRFEHLGDVADVDRAVSILDIVLNETPDDHPAKADRRANVGAALLFRFERMGNLADIHRSVAMLESALKCTPKEHPGKSSILHDLGRSLLSRFQRLTEVSDLDGSVAAFDKAVQLTPDGAPDKQPRVFNFGNSLLRRFERFGDRADLDLAVAILEAATSNTAENHPDKPLKLNNLGNILLSRFESRGELVDLSHSVTMFEAAVRLAPDGHPGKPSILNNLGNSLLRHFARLGNIADLNRAVLMLERAAKCTLKGDRDKVQRLSNFASVLLLRYQHLGDVGDLTQSTSIFEAAAASVAVDDPDEPSILNNLGSTLYKRFERLGDPTDLDRAIEKCERAVDRTQDGHPDKPSRLNSLGNCWLRRFNHCGTLDDLDRAMLVLKSGVELTPDGHTEKPERLNSLGTSFIYRFKQGGDLADLSQAMSIFKSAVGLTPDGHPDKPVYLENLANTLGYRFEQLHDPKDLQQMLLQYTCAASSLTGPAHIRFQAAAKWAECANLLNHPSRLDAYTTAINLLPELAWLGLSIKDRHHQISDAGEVVRDAAAAAIEAGQCTKAVEWLDQGRSIIWGQLLSLRTPVDDLRKKYPILADKLVLVSTQLETRGSASRAVAEGTAQKSLQSIAQESHTLAHERETILKQIRACQGFERFLLPKAISELSPAAARGPVVLINASRYRCDALILRPGLADVVTLGTLTGLTLRDARGWVESLRSVLFDEGRSVRGIVVYREGYQAPDEVFVNILSELWKRVVTPVLAVLGPSGQDLARIWWCATGPLAFLPIHAAGLYGENEPLGSKVSDLLVSSYTPSLSVLIEGFRGHQSQEEFQILAVDQPSAVGQSYIPGTQEEIRCIETLAAGKFPVIHLAQDMATVDSVQHNMKKSRWVHFACHGTQNISSPTDSAFFLAGSSQLTLSNIIQLSLPNADLAFLSACQTATGARNLEDESVHLAAGMLLAGYRGVIGTMWSIMDNDAPQVASDVYDHLLKGSTPDPMKAAEALHFAVQRLRQQSGGKKSFVDWVPFIHLGA